MVRQFPVNAAGTKRNGKGIKGREGERSPRVRKGKLRLLQPPRQAGERPLLLGMRSGARRGYLLISSILRAIMAFLGSSSAALR